MAVRGESEIKSNPSIHKFPPRDNQLYNAALDAYEQGNYREALERSIALIDKGYPHAYTLAGTILEEGGKGVPANPQRALFYYQKAVDEVGAVEAWLGLGRLFFFGKGVPQDCVRAFHYYSVVDQDTDHRVAHLMLGRMYMEGVGVGKDLKKARAHLEKAVGEGAIHGSSLLGELEQMSGHRLLGAYLKLRAAIVAWTARLRDPSDYRLRQW